MKVLVILFIFILSLSALQWCEEESLITNNQRKIVIKCVNEIQGGLSSSSLSTDKLNKNSIKCQQKSFTIQENILYFASTVSRNDVEIVCEHEKRKEFQFQFLNEQNGSNSTNRRKGSYSCPACWVANCYEELHCLGYCTICESNYLLYGWKTGSVNGYGCSGYDQCLSGCPNGHWNNNGVCEQCGAGWHYNGGSNRGSCYRCPSGTYASGSGWTDCANCPAGQYAPGDTNTGCSTCGIGTYSTERSGGCTPCSAGYYNDKTGQGGCTPCGTGTFNPNTGSSASSACQSCPTGHYNDAQGKGSCTACGTGTYNPNKGSKAASACVNCNPGYYNDKTGQGSCTACSEGTYNPKTGSKAATACQSCLPGYYNDKTG